MCIRDRLIEPYAVDRYSGQIDREDLERMYSLFDGAKKGMDCNQIYQLDDEFHHFFVERMKNKYLSQAYEITNYQNYRLRILSGEMCIRDRYGLGYAKDFNERSKEELLNMLHVATSERHFIMYEALRTVSYTHLITDEDWRNREKWDQYLLAVDEMLVRTSTTYAPWIIVEGNNKYYARIKVLKTVVEALEKKLEERKKTK